MTESFCLIVYDMLPEHLDENIKWIVERRANCN